MVVFINGIKVVGITSVADVVGAAATFTKLTTTGTLTYEDVTNIDSVGFITARKGLNVTGIATATSFEGDGSALTGIESWNQQDTWLYGG